VIELMARAERAKQLLLELPVGGIAIFTDGGSYKNKQQIGPNGSDRHHEQHGGTDCCGTSLLWLVNNGSYMPAVICADSELALTGMDGYMYYRPNFEGVPESPVKKSG
jgi:hypothetical protein